jgi:hypothetical protein
MSIAHQENSEERVPHQPSQSAPCYKYTEAFTSSPSISKSKPTPKEQI